MVVVRGEAHILLRRLLLARSIQFAQHEFRALNCSRHPAAGIARRIVRQEGGHELLQPPLLTLVLRAGAHPQHVPLCAARTECGSRRWGSGPMV